MVDNRKKDGLIDRIRAIKREYPSRIPFRAGILPVARMKQATGPILLGLGLALLLVFCFATDPLPSRQDLIDQMQSCTEPRTKGVDPTTLEGKVLCGYQGWFNAEGDGAGRGFYHFGINSPHQKSGRFEPGYCSIDFWPDVSDLKPSERYDTPFRHGDGSVAQVFSCYNNETVIRHFRWMRDYGIDGVFVHRFPGEIKPGNELGFRHFNRVMAACQIGANRYGRVWALRYDVPANTKSGELRSVVMEDFKLLVDRMKIRKDPSYLHHNGKPVVYLWGVGFNDNRQYTLEECAELIDFLKNDPKYGGNFVVVGVPTCWRTLQSDAVSDPKLLEIVTKADLINPWTPGRYRDIEGIYNQVKTRWKPDMEWCRKRNIIYAPTVFPGFSWHNLNPKSPQPLIPRLKGQFYWEQFYALMELKPLFIYVAMFDEINEGTAIFKCTNIPPVGESRFLDMEGMPSDHYLWLTGQGGRMLRGEIKPAKETPIRN